MKKLEQRFYSKHNFKSKRDKAMSFNDQLSVIGGNLALCVGMSILSMAEVVLFIYIVISGIIIDIKETWKKLLSYFGLATPENIKDNLSLHKVKNIFFLPDKSWKEFEEDELKIQKLYVSK